MAWLPVNNSLFGCALLFMLISDIYLYPIHCLFGKAGQLSEPDQRLSDRGPERGQGCPERLSERLILSLHL